MYENNDDFKLVANNKLFTIPSDFRSLSDVNPDILKILITKRIYEIKSNASNNTIESFIKHWVTGQPPDFQVSNIFEFANLSEEFDRMRDLIEMFRQNKPDNNRSELVRKQYLKIENIQFKNLTYQGKIKKYQQIISILFKYNHIGPLFKNDAYLSCMKDDDKQVYANCQKLNIENGFTFLLDLQNKEATVIDCKRTDKTVLIPRTVSFNDEEFMITTISKYFLSKSRNIEYVEFPQNSELRLIDEKAFASSLIKSIKIPSKVKIIGKNAFNNCIKLNKVEFEENSELEIIDESAFSSSELIEEIKIPSKVKKISKFAFLYCNKLNKIEFEENSELEEIDDSAFFNNNLESITLPSSIVKLSRNWCCSIHCLKNITIIKNKNKENIKFYDNKFIIGKSNQNSDVFDVLFFVRRDIENVTIPSFIKRIAPFAFECCLNLKNVDFDSDSELQCIDMFAFANSSIQRILIPSKTTKIKSNAFSNCTKLITVDFCENSQLYLIGDYAFSGSSIEKIRIPKVVAICRHAFSYCIKLKSVEIQSGLKLMGSQPFNDSSIETITIPSSTHSIACNWCSGTYKLKNVIIKPTDENYITFYNNEFIIEKSNIKNDVYDVLIFAQRDIENATIPSFIKKVESHSFEDCNKLKSVTFLENSEIQNICYNSFSKSSIEKVSFPSHLKQIDDNAFISCNKLKYIEFHENSQLKSIGKYSFGFAAVENICLPSRLVRIGPNSFSDCRNLQTVIFSKNQSELKVIEKNAFSNSTLKSIEIPSDIEKFEESWCFNTKFLNEIKIIEKEQKNIAFCDKLLVNKFDKKSDNFDVIIFAARNIKKILVPSFIRKISNYAFECCLSLKKVEFKPDSELEIINGHAFAHSSIEHIKIPSNVKKIDRFLFYECLKLNSVNFADNSNLTTIGEYAFSLSSIRCIFIPSKVSSIDHSAFKSCRMIQIIEFEDNSILKSISAKIFQPSSPLIMAPPPQ